MAQRRFGPTRGAGTVIIEKEAEATLTPGALGVVAYTGILKKGPVGKAFQTTGRKDLLFRAGGIIPDSLVPDAALDFWKLGKGAGGQFMNRVTDGTERNSSISLTGRRNPRASRVILDAGNGGRWGGKKNLIIDEYLSVTALTLTLTNVPANLQDDELEGAVVSFNVLPGKSFIVVSNTAAGVLTFAADVDLLEELGAPLPADTLISVTLSNSGEALAVKIKNGQENPTTEWGLDIYLVEANVQTLTKSFNNLSSDPTSPNYFVKIINDDSDADFLLKATDDNIGTPTADIRPANYAGISSALAATTLNAQIHDVIVNAPSAVGFKAALRATTPGASVINDSLTLVNTTPGARGTVTLTFGATPDDGDAITIDTVTLTYRTAPTDPLTEILIGADATAAKDNTVAFINAQSLVSTHPLYLLAFAESTGGTTLDVFAQTAGLAGNFASTEAGGANVPTFGAVTLLGGLDQIWSFESNKMPFVTGLSVTSGVAFVSPNQFGFGFTLIDMTRVSAKAYAALDEIAIEVRPLEVNNLVGGLLFPKATDIRSPFQIIDNDADTITVKAGSDMTLVAATGDTFRVEYIKELSGGYDGIANVGDLEFENAYDPGTSPLNSLRGKNLGLVKLASPGVTSTAIQKAGVAFGESQNWQYRYEIPANIVSESAAEEFVNETLGRNDFAVGSFPSFGKVTNPDGSPSKKLISMTGAIHGVEAKFAKDFDGFHKAAAGEDAKLTNMLERPDGLQDKVLNEEFLNPVGLSILIKKGGNFVIWGDRTLSIASESRFKHKRETLSHYENVFFENFDFIIFALNAEQAGTDKRATSSFLAFFQPEFAKSAVVGSQALSTDEDSDAAVILKIDGENNTEGTRGAGDLNAELGINIVDTVERFIITISQRGITEG